MEDNYYVQKSSSDTLFPVPNPAGILLTNLISLQSDIIYNCFLTMISPFNFVWSLASDFHSYNSHASDKAIPSPVSVPLKKIGFGLLAAVHACMVLVLLMVVAMILGVGLVRLWAEEPVFLKRSLHFDYTDIHPKAVFSFANCRDFDGVPYEHTFYVSLHFLMPDSDFNRAVGVFQVTAEVVSTKGDVVAKTSRPCMLHFRSQPVRLVRTFLTAIPLLLGMTSETQEISIPMLQHKERIPRTETIRVTLLPRAGTVSLPQLCKAEMVIKSELPWKKEFVRRWRWTFYVWTSLYIYIMLLVILLSYFRPLVISAVSFSGRDLMEEVFEEETEEIPVEESDEVSVMLRRWRHSRRKRKQMLQLLFPENVASSASSFSLSRDETSATVEDEYEEHDDDDDEEDSHSVCFTS